MYDKIDPDIKEEMNKEIDEVIKKQKDKMIERKRKSAEGKDLLIMLKRDLGECQNVAYRVDRQYPNMFAVAGIYYIYQRITDYVDKDSKYEKSDRKDVIDEIITNYLYEIESMLRDVTLQFKDQLMDCEGAKNKDRFHYDIGEKMSEVKDRLDNALKACNEALDELENRS